MGFQQDSIAFNEDKDKLVATCSCMSLEHGILVFHCSETDEDFFLSFKSSSYSKNLWERIKETIRFFKRQEIEADMFLVPKDAKKMGQWLIEQADKNIEFKAQHGRHANQKSYKGYKEALVENQTLRKAFEELAELSKLKIEESTVVPGEKTLTTKRTTLTGVDENQALLAALELLQDTQDSAEESSN